ncbi:MAG TPA: Fur family transcriptional regulator [Candidatus Marinimicrobia bacterium]|jgi:Fur family ferric uptake transcriptional regulator|nr:transcriptional repressor [Candidatus Neomarinimicrobiota bacterium]HBN45955.1 transcriptional repressor [Candidatus Neomarinimicrobiota bacterium]HJL75228.1 Fur family transcriptional regulator [Candidatus Neomarinimicrobiota bacterium]HJM70217.1 Fur family transcriptional regulator [Candidatus Neomarinimicrobiota bacterium]|tara:strand:- start:21468 stop:21893 length:426 start_codon:yes stop_codon:yes gene_type:complete
MSKGLNRLKKILHHEGLRFTTQREAVWREIISSDDHRDADEIYMAIRKKGVSVSRATVYRTIDVLVKNNMVRKLDVGTGPSKFEHKIDTYHHDHIICIQCGRIEEFMVDQIEDLQDKVTQEYGFKLVRHIHQLFGLCKNCQ